MQCKCGNSISEARWSMGYRVCLSCGETKAQADILDKSQRIAPAYNKGPLVYMGAPDVAKDNLQGSMNSQGRSTATIASGPVVASVAASRPVVVSNVVAKPARKPIGVAWVKGQAYAVFSTSDPIIAKAERCAIYRSNP